MNEPLVSSVSGLDLNTKKVSVIYQEKGIGPADIAFVDGVFFIPELVGSRIISVRVK